MMGLYSTDNEITITEVDGSIFTGRYAVDGSWNGVNKTNASGFVGLINPCGAINYTINNSTTPVPRYAANGSWNVTDSNVNNGALVVNLVTLSNASDMLALEWGGLAIDFTDNAFAASSGLYGSAYIKDGSLADKMLFGESLGLAIDFTDSEFSSTSGLYGSAYIVS